MIFVACQYMFNILSEFGRFKIRLANSLALRDVMTLSTYFSLTKADTDKIKRSENPGLDLVWALESEDVISPTDISELVEGLRDCNLGGVVDTIREDLPRTFSPPSISEGKKLYQCNKVNVGNGRYPCEHTW